MVRIHSPRPNSSKTYRHQTRISGSKKGPFVDPTLTRLLDSVGRCSNVLIDLRSDDFDDPWGPYQEVWSSTRVTSLVREYL